MRERLEFYLRDVRGFAYDVVNAVLAAGSDDVVDAIARAEAVSEVRGLGGLRVDLRGIQAHQEHPAPGRRNEKEHGPGTRFRRPHREIAEKELAAAIPDIAATVRDLREQRNYGQALVEISRFASRWMMFFDKVMVMVDDESVRANRLALLRESVERVLHHRRLQRDRDRRQVMIVNMRRIVTTSASEALSCRGTEKQIPPPKHGAVIAISCDALRAISW